MILYVRRGNLHVENDGGPLNFKLNGELILEKNFGELGYDHNKICNDIYNYINSKEYNDDLRNIGYTHYYKVFINTTQYGGLDGYNLKKTFKTLDEAKSKIKEMENDIFAYVIYEIYKNESKNYNIVESSPAKSGLIYFLPKYLREPYDNWRKFNNIIIGLKTGILKPIGGNMHFSVEQYEKLDSEAVDFLLFKEVPFKRTDFTDVFNFIDDKYQIKIPEESIFYK